MATATATATPTTNSAIRVWGSRVATAIPILMLATSAAMKLSHAPSLVEKWTTGFGYSESSLTPIGLLELAVALTYAFPKTRILGAILVTGYLGGATASHVRIGDPFVIPVVLGALAWLGVWLRDERIRALVPLDQGA